MNRNKSVSLHKFSMVPRADIPRSAFTAQCRRLTTFEAGDLVPVFCEEVVPGDRWNLRCFAVGRLATLLAPLMDNIYLDTFWFYVPNRLVWTNWVRFLGERDDPDDSVDFTVPVINSPDGGYDIGTIYDYFGLPCSLGSERDFEHSALPLRMYHLIWNEWFRDQNMQDSAIVNKDNGPDTYTDYELKQRGKRHDYFTSCLPFLQKGDAVTLPLGTSAPVVTGAGAVLTGPQEAVKFTRTDGAAVDTNLVLSVDSGGLYESAGTTSGGTAYIYPNNLSVNLNDASAATINEIRMAFQIQRLLERDARGGTRHAEIILAHFGVRSPDARLQRPEFLGSTSELIGLVPVAQTSESAGTPQANLSAFGKVNSQSGFTQSFTEHGYVIGLVSLRADLTYQQGLRRHWSRQTKYDFYWPALSMLGEQAVLRKELFCVGEDESDDTVFGYQERYGEMRYFQSEITGRFRSADGLPLDFWHLAQDFETAPVLGNDFIIERPPINRVVAVAEEAGGAHMILDVLCRVNMARPMPLYGVPGMMDHL